MRFDVARLVVRLLYHVRPSDPLVLGIAVAALAIVGVAASLLPARRAIAVDPVIVLAQE